MKIIEKNKIPIEELVNRGSERACRKAYRAKVLGECSSCGCSVITGHKMNFSNVFEKQEYLLSGLCPTCQKGYFGNNNGYIII